MGLRVILMLTGRPCAAPGRRFLTAVGRCHGWDGFLKGAGLMSRGFTAIFRHAFPFVYGPANTPTAGAVEVYRD